jgi:hypothetical protein
MFRRTIIGQSIVDLLMRHAALLPCRLYQCLDYLRRVGLGSPFGRGSLSGLTARRAAEDDAAEYR